MNKEIEKRIAIFSNFIEQITRGVEGLVYKDKHIGSSIFLLNHIKSKEDCNMKDIIDYLNVLPSAATRRIDKLVELDLVFRDISTEDRRIVNIKLTQEGENLYRRFMQNRQLGIKTFMNIVSNEEAEMFFDVIDRMTKYAAETLTLEKKS